MAGSSAAPTQKEAGGVECGAVPLRTPTRRECGDVMVSTYEWPRRHACNRAIAALQRMWDSGWSSPEHQPKWRYCMMISCVIYNTRRLLPRSACGASLHHPICQPRRRNATHFDLSPFRPVTQTLFRLPLCCRRGCQMQSPYARFQYRSRPSVLCEHLHVPSRTISPIALAPTGIDCVTARLHHHHRPRHG